MTQKPACDATHECTQPITHLDAKGYIYCTPHGQNRQQTHRCRKLRPHEINRINHGKQIQKY